VLAKERESVDERERVDVLAKDSRRLRRPTVVSPGLQFPCLVRICEIDYSHFAK
jgi:hypothetical protein